MFNLSIFKSIKIFLFFSLFISHLFSDDFKYEKIITNQTQTIHILEINPTKYFIKPTLAKKDTKCQLCFSKSKDKILNVHHIISRKKGSNSPDNLITLCKTCHTKIHREKNELIFTKKSGFKDTSQITTTRWFIYNALKEKYPTSLTYGYITKHNRIKNNLEKSHRVDARVIAGNSLLEPEISYEAKQIRKNNRRLHKNTILQGGIRKKNTAKKIVKGFQLFDKVKYENMEVFIYGRRESGYFKIAYLDGTTLHNSVSYKKLTLLKKSKTLLINKKRSGISYPCLKTGVSMSSFR